MTRTNNPVLILKTGSTIPAIARERGDFEDWIKAGMGLADSAFITVDVSRDQALPPPAMLSGVVITGSPAMVTEDLPWIAASSRFILDAMTAEVPMLGICFGHQLIAQALGGRVGWHPGGREIGTTRICVTSAAAADPLFGDLPSELPVHVTHKQSVAALPAGANVLASNVFESHHALRFADLAWGVQFHPEFDAGIMAGYIRERHEQIAGEGLDPQLLLDQVVEAPEAQALLPRFAALCR